MISLKKSFLAGENWFCMRILGLVILFFAIGAPVGWAQEQDRIRVKLGDKIDNHDFTYTAYRFPVFREGIIYYYDGGLAKGKMNYNQLLSEMHFISPKGDTMALDNLYTVKFVAIGDAKFYHDLQKKGFGEEVADFNSVKLLIKHNFKPSDKEKGVAYGQYSNTSATTNYGAYSVNGQLQQLNPNEYLVYAKKASYILSDQNNQFHPANKASILKVFAKHKAAVEKFMKENRVDFQKEADLKKLLDYCTQLT